MRLRTLVFSLAPLFAASIASAQPADEPDEQDQDEPAAPRVVAPTVVAPVVTQPVVVAPVVAQPVIVAPGMTPMVAPGSDCAAPARRESVMQNRFAVGFSLGSMGLAPKDLPDDQTAFIVGELAFRFRVTRHFELELSGGGGREHTKDGMEGDLEVKQVMLAARWRFMPESKWNLFLTGGLGGASIARHDATEQERKDATQPMGMLGVGIERRFRHLALQAELRAIGMGKAQKDDQMTDAPTAMAVTTTDPNSADIQRNGGSLTIGLSYYF
jgi:hypothetical protein